MYRCDLNSQVPLTFPYARIPVGLVMKGEPLQGLHYLSPTWPSRSLSWNHLERVRAWSKCCRALHTTRETRKQCYKGIFASLALHRQPTITPVRKHSVDKNGAYNFVDRKSLRNNSEYKDKNFKPKNAHLSQIAIHGGFKRGHVNCRGV